MTNNAAWLRSPSRHAAPAGTPPQPAPAEQLGGGPLRRRPASVAAGRPADDQGSRQADRVLAYRISEVENGKGRLSGEFVEACERTLPANGALLTLFEGVVEEETTTRHARLATRRRSRHTERPAATPVQSSEVASAEPTGSRPLLGPQGVAASNRRQALRAGGMVAGAVVTGKLLELLGTEPLAMTRALRTTTVDGAELDYHEATVDRYLVDYEASGPVLLLAPVLEHFHAVRRLVEDQPIAYQRRLCRVGAKLATLLGIFAYEDQARSRAWFHAAQRAAHEADDNVLSAWALVKESLLPTYGGYPKEALALLDNAAYQAGRSPSVVAAMAAASQARAHALSDDEAAALRALERAEHVLDRATAEERRLFAFSDAQLAFYRTTCHVRLGRRDAEQAAAQALDLYRTAPHYMDPTLVRFDLATWYVRQGEVEQACHVGHQALVIPAEHRTGPVVQRAHELLAELESYQASAAVREFGELLACL